MRRERHVAQYALRGAELRPAPGVGRKPVVDVDRGERDWMPRDEGGRGVEEDHRIHAARKGKRDARAGVHMLGKCGADRRVDRANPR